MYSTVLASDAAAAAASDADLMIIVVESDDGRNVVFWQRWRLAGDWLLLHWLTDVIVVAMASVSRL